MTVTVWATFQLLGVNVRWAGETTTSDVLPLLMSKTTFDSGLAVRTIVNVSVVPFSETVATALLSANPAVSLSRLVTLRNWSGSGSQRSSEYASATPMFRVMTWSPSTVAGLSSTPCSVTVWAVSQLPGAKAR